VSGETAGIAEASTRPKRALRKWLLAFLLLTAAAGAWWLQRTARAIERQSNIDEAERADIIIVLGAAEYRGRPSPVLQARLNHALYLYLQKLAPRILTTGGAGGDPNFTEGEVGRSYLSRAGVPSEAILVEPEGESTAQSLAAAAEIMRKFDMKTCIVVSDGYHIYRVKRFLENRGYKVFGSPRPGTPRDDWRQEWLHYRQAIAFGLWRAGINI
jgi:uncharacterized SAM-binding protein YcdF (DUF218 family)